MMSNEIIFNSSNGGEIPRETLIVRTGPFFEEVISYKSSKSIGSNFCNIISLDCNKIGTIMQEYIPEDYKPVNMSQIIENISHAISSSSYPKVQVTKKEKAIQKQKEYLKRQGQAFFKKLIEFNPIFTIYSSTSSTSIFDCITKALEDIKKYREYANLCMSDEFYLDTNFISFLNGLEKILYIRFPNLPENYMASASSKDFQEIRKDYEELLQKGCLSSRYNADSLGDICAASLIELSQRNFIIKQCQNCHKYFIPYLRSDTIYCDRISPQDSNRTCKEYGSEKLWYEKLKSNETSKLYRNIYQAKQMLVKRHTKESDPILHDLYLSSFEAFKSQSARWKADIKSKNKTEDEYIKWLKTVKEKKVL